MENLPILQDFVPYRSRCPASIEITKKETIKKTVAQGKGTADHLMPLGDWFTISLRPLRCRCPITVKLTPQIVGYLIG